MLENRGRDPEGGLIADHAADDPAAAHRLLDNPAFRRNRAVRVASEESISVTTNERSDGYRWTDSNDRREVCDERFPRNLPVREADRLLAPDQQP